MHGNYEPVTPLQAWRQGFVRPIGPGLHVLYAYPGDIPSAPWVLHTQRTLSSGVPLASTINCGLLHSLLIGGIFPLFVILT